MISSVKFFFSPVVLVLIFAVFSNTKSTNVMGSGEIRKILFFLKGIKLINNNFCLRFTQKCSSKAIIVKVSYKRTRISKTKR